MARQTEVDRLLNAARAALHDRRAIDAIDALLQAEKLAPRNASIFLLRSEAHLARGAVGDALVDLSVATRHAGNAEPAGRLAALLARYTLDDPSDLDRRGLVAALGVTGIALAPIAAAALSLWWRTDVPAPVRTAEDATTAARELVGRRLAPCLAEPLLHAALRAGPVTEPAIERLLTAVRGVLLRDGPLALIEDRPRVDLALALLAQVIDNEHVWAETADETAAVDKLVVTPEDLQRTPVEASGRFLLKALFRQLDLSSETPLPDTAIRALVPKALRALVAERRADDTDEAKIASDIRTLSATDDATSRNVAAQYEASPYPRWRTLLAPREGSYRRALQAFAGVDHDPFGDRPIEVLVAGAGTGQQALSAAIGYGPQARVTALDLSRRSLAYGARMARRIGIEPVQFLQGDILAAEALGRTFDIIECIGVLHHMADPLAGWRALVPRLAPGGLMYIGLYSARARADITALRRDDKDWPGIAATDSEARAYRARLLARPDGAPGTGLRRSHDFYTLSNFRDLVLHAHEIPLTLGEIARWLDELGLTFLGFTLPPEILAAFGRAHPDQPWPGRLADWESFEQDHPQTFDGMYCFWCRRTADGAGSG